MAVALQPDLLGRYRRFTLHNSPYVAHDDGRAVDLYPPAGAPSPVAGEVVDVRTVAAPPRPYAADEDHLLVVAVDWAASPVSWTGDGPRPGTASAGTDDPVVARVLHVDPDVEPGDRVAVGDHLGRRVRAGFFAPWVAPHLHVGFRAPDADPYRASGSLPLAAGVAVEPLPWDGTGTVVERGDTYAVLDAPAHPGGGFAGIAARVGDVAGPDGGGDDSRNGDETPGEEAGIPVALDGGLPHYDGGGLLDAGGGSDDVAGGQWTDAAPVRLLGERVGAVADGRVAWDDVTVLVDGEPATGLSLFAARDGRFGAKLVSPDGPPALGATVTVSVECRSTGPRLRE